MSRPSLAIWAILSILMLMAGTLMLSSPVPEQPAVVPWLLLGGGAGSTVGVFIAAALR